MYKHASKTVLKTCPQKFCSFCYITDAPEGKCVE